MQQSTSAVCCSNIKKLITKLKLLTFINKNNLHKQIKVFNFVSQTKRKNIINIKI